jgi:hypothetical protein
MIMDSQIVLRVITHAISAMMGLIMNVCHAILLIIGITIQIFRSVFAKIVCYKNKNKLILIIFS